MATISDVRESGGAGRVDMWTRAMDALSPKDFLLGTWEYPATEGWLGIITQIGLVGIALLVLVVALIVRRRPTLLLPVLILLIGAVLDSSYRLFPTWFLFAALAAAEPPAKEPQASPPAAVRRPAVRPRALAPIGTQR